jgi:hypothetical protein
MPAAAISAMRRMAESNARRRCVVYCAEPPIGDVHALSEYCWPSIGTEHGLGYSQQVPSAVFA